LHELGRSVLLDEISDPYFLLFRERVLAFATIKIWELEIEVILQQIFATKKGVFVQDAELPRAPVGIIADGFMMTSFSLYQSRLGQKATIFTAGEIV
jgi:hypothetical protein